MFLWVLMAFLVIAGLGLFLIEVDVVVSARGKIIPAGDVKTLQPLETGVVSGIHVKEGDYVAKGATLVEIDPALDTADLEGKEKNLRFSRAASQRINAVLGERALPAQRRHRARAGPGTAPALRDAEGCLSFHAQRKREGAAGSRGIPPGAQGGAQEAGEHPPARLRGGEAPAVPGEDRGPGREPLPG